jgi:hypothetical protein
MEPSLRTQRQQRIQCVKHVLRPNTTLPRPLRAPKLHLAR